MFNRYLVSSICINKGLKLNAFSRATCIRKYTLTYDEEEREKKRKARAVLVNVIMPDQKVTPMTLEQAQKMAKRRDLTLTKLLDPPKFAAFAGHDVYEVCTKSQHIKQLAEEAEVVSEFEFKDKKTLTVSATIATHDLEVKIKQIKRWLAKRHIVVVIVSDDGKGEGMKERSTLIQEECKELCKINTVNKKKQMVLTLAPQINTSQDQGKPEAKNEPKEKNKGKVKSADVGQKATAEETS